MGIQHHSGCGTNAALSILFLALIPGALAACLVRQPRQAVAEPGAHVTLAAGPLLLYLSFS